MDDFGFLDNFTSSFSLDLALLVLHYVLLPLITENLQHSFRVTILSQIHTRLAIFNLQFLVRGAVLAVAWAGLVAGAGVAEGVARLMLVTRPGGGRLVGQDLCHLPVLQRTLPPTCTRETLMLHCYDDCVTFIISSLLIGKLGRNNFDHSQPIRIPMFKRFQLGKILLYYLRLCRIL